MTMTKKMKLYRSIKAKCVLESARKRKREEERETVNFGREGGGEGGGRQMDRGQRVRNKKNTSTQKC